MPKSKVAATEIQSTFFFIRQKIMAKNTLFPNKIRFSKQIGLIFANDFDFDNRLNNKFQNKLNMKKALIIALCSIAVAFTACKKPEPIDYAANYVGNYLGQFTLTITSMNNDPSTSMSFPIDSIVMNIAKGQASNSITATVTIENEAYQAVGTASEEKVTFNPIHLNLNKSDFSIICDINLEGEPIVNDTLCLNGNFAGTGSAMIWGQEQQFDEISGTVNGKLKKQ